jgi:ABC-2 type transport system permease protein
MIGRIAKHDWRNLKADRTLWAIGLVLAASIGYGVKNGATWVQFQQRTVSGAIAEEGERLAKMKQGIAELNAGRIQLPSWKDPRNAFSAGYTLASHWAVMPPGPLAPLAIGQSDLLPYYFKISLRSRDTILGNDEIENPLHLLSGRFDLAFVIIYLYPLVILTLGYNLISGEKEDGTLAITMSQPVSLRSLSLGKIMFRGAFVLVLATLLSIAGGLLSGVDLRAEGVLPRLAVWIAVVAAYGAFWFTLSVAVNALGRGSSTNALTLAGCWLAFVLLIPSLLNVAIKTAHPVPSRVEMIQAMRAASDEIFAQRSKLMARYLEDHPELTGASSDTMAKLALRNVAMMEETERRVQPVLDRFDRQLTLQQNLVDRYRFLSPAILTQAALYDLAGSNTFRYKHFLELVDDFHRQWRNYFFPLMLKGVNLSESDIARMPRFQFQEEASSTVLTRVSSALVGLVVLTAIILVAAARMLGHYPIAG